MNTGKNTDLTRRGFTILELLIVISIMALLATLATGAALKAMANGRKKKVDAMITALETGLSNYRARENKWPFELNGKLENDGCYWWRDKDNAYVFKDMLSSSTVYLDSSALLTSVKGRMSVRQALEKGVTSIPIGYPDPDNPNSFKYFNVRYAPLTDTVKVMKP